MTRPAEHALITQMLEAIEWLTTGTQMVGDSHWSISNEALENGIKAYDAAREYLAAPLVYLVYLFDKFFNWRNI